MKIPSDRGAKNAPTLPGVNGTSRVRYENDEHSPKYALLHCIETVMVNGVGDVGTVVTIRSPPDNFD